MSDAHANTFTNSPNAPSLAAGGNNALEGTRILNHPVHKGHSIHVNFEAEDLINIKFFDAKNELYSGRIIDKEAFVNEGKELYYSAQDHGLVEYHGKAVAGHVQRHVIGFDGEETTSEIPKDLAPLKGELRLDVARELDKERERSQEPQRPALESKRTYLAVPYEERGEAAKRGADFDDEKKLWYVTTPKAVEATRKWSVEGKTPASETERDPKQEFSDFLRSEGMDLQGQAVMDGKWHRIAILGEKQKNASYIGHIDGGVPNGLLNNFKGEQSKWVFSGQKLSKDEIARAIEAGKEAAKERAAELKQTHEKAAKTAYGIWKNLKEWAQPSNCNYLKRKGVLGYGAKRDDKGRMVLALRDADMKLKNLQFVGEEKRYLTGGQKEGLFHTIDPQRYLKDEDKLSRGDTLILAEGYATGASVHQMVKKPVLVAFDADNLVKVATDIRQRFPDVTLLIAGDDDHHLPLQEKPLPNKGRVKAIEAAKAVDGYAVIPPLTQSEKDKGLTDWNDLARARGEQKAAFAFIYQVREELDKGKNRAAEHEVTNAKKLDHEMEMA